MWPAWVTKRATFSAPAMLSTLLLTASSSIPLRRTTRSTTTLFALYAPTTAGGSPGPATNLPGGAAAVPPSAMEGEVGVGTTVVASAAELTSLEGKLEVAVDADEVAVGVDSVGLTELLWDIRVSTRKPTSNARTAKTPIWAAGLSLMAFLTTRSSRSREGAGKKAPTCRCRSA